MSRPSAYVLLCTIILSASCPAYADKAADLTEVYADNGLPDWGQPVPEGLHGLAGGGWFRGDRIVGDPRRRSAPLPLVAMAWGDRAYWSFTGGGVWLYRSDEWPLQFGAGVRLHAGYNPGHDPELIGMESRKSSVDSYANALWKAGGVNVGATYYHDMGKVTYGDSATIRISRHLLLSRKLTLTPRIGVEFEDARLVGYYYGVKPSEATPQRPAYTGHHAMNYGAGGVAVYRLNRSWSLLGGFFATHLGNGISDSPIVFKRHTKVAFIGAGWTF